tara:strand:+ start:860 stop:1258 length:399 start_codon:yes stop_codon:yes gene_type:complete
MKQTFKIALGFIVILTLLTGCLGRNDIPAPIQIKTKPIDKPELNLPQADELVQRKIEWILITPENYEKAFLNIKNKGRPLVLFGLTDKGYENISLNLSDIRMYISQQQSIISAYERYYNQAESTLDNAVVLE